MKGRFDAIQYAKSLEKQLKVDPARKKKNQDALADIEKRAAEEQKKGSDISKITSLVSDAKALLEKNDYVKAEGMVTQCEEELRKFSAASVEAVVQKASAIINEVEMSGVDVSKALELIKSAEQALRDNNAERARQLALEGQKEAERIRDSQLNEAVSYARELVNESEKLGMDVKKFRDILAGVDASVMKGEFASALGAAVSITEEMDKHRRSYFREFLSRVQNAVATAKDEGTDTARFEKNISKAKSSIDSRDYETAADLLRETEVVLIKPKAPKTGKPEAEEALRSPEELLGRAKSAGLPVDELLTEMAGLTKKLEAKEFDSVVAGALELRSRLEELLKGGEGAANALAEAHTLLAGASKMGLDLKKHNKRVDEAEARFKSGKHDEALKLSRDAQTALKDSMSKFSSDAIRSLEGELGVFREQGALTTEAEELLRKARVALDTSKFEEAFGLARQTLNLLDSLQEAFTRYGPALSRGEALVAAAKERGGDVTEAAGMLEQARQAAAKGDYRNAAVSATKVLELMDSGAQPAPPVPVEGIGPALDMIRRSDEEGAFIENTEKLAIEAMYLFEKGDAKKASAAAQNLEKTFNSQTRAFLLALDAISRAQETIAEGLMEGLNITEETRKLDGARDFCQKGDYEAARYGAEDIGPALRVRCKAALEAAVLSANKVLDDFTKSGAKLPRAKEYLRRSKELAECGRFGISHGYAELAAEDAKSMGNKLRQAKDARGLVEAALATARNINVGVTELEGAMASVDGMIARAEYDGALTQAANSVEMAEAVFGERAKALCDEFSKLIGSVQGLHLDLKPEMDALEQGMGYLENNEWTDSILAVQDAKGLLLVKKEQHEKASAALVDTGKMMAEAEVQGISSESLKAEQAEAELALADGKFEESINASLSLTEVIRGLLAEKAAGSIGELKSVRDEAAKAGVFMDDLKDRMAALPAGIESGNFSVVVSDSRTLAEEIKERCARHDTAAKALAGVQAFIEEAKGIGAEVSPAEDLIGMARFAAERGEYDNVMDYVKRAEGELMSASTAVLEGLEIVIAKRMEELRGEGVELGAAGSALEEGAALISGHQFRACFSALKKVETDVEVRKDQHKNTLKVLSAAEKSIAGARDQGVKAGAAVELLETAMTLAAGGDYPKAVEAAEQCRETVTRAIEGHQQTKGAIEVARAHSKDAETMGADTARAKELLDQAEASLEAGDYDSGMEKAVESEQEVTRAQETLVQDTAAMAKSAVDAAAGIGADTTAPKELLARAEAAVQAREFEEGFRLARESLESAQQSMESHSTALGSLTEIQKLVQIAHSEGIRMDALMRDLEKAREALQRFDYESCSELAESSRKEAEQRIEIATSAKNEMERCTKALRSALDVGADTGSAQTMLTEAEKAFADGDFETAGVRASDSFNILTDSQRQIVWAPLSGLLLETEMAGEEGANVAETAALLDQAGESLQSGEYKRALDLGRASGEKLSAARSSFMEASTILTASCGILEEARYMEAEVALAGDLATGARDALSLHDYASAIELAHQVKDEVQRGFKSLLTQMAAASERTLSDAESKGVRCRRCRDRLARAKRSIDFQDYKGARLMLDTCDSSLLAAVEAHHTASMMMGSLTEAISRAAGFGMDVQDAREKAAAVEGLVSSGEYTRGMELSTALLGEIADCEKDLITERMADIRKALEAGRALGMDISVETEALDEARGALDSGDVELAFRTARKASEDLTTNRREFERVAGVAGGLEAGVKKAKEWGVDTAPVESILAKSRSLLAKGSYVAAEDELKKGAASLDAVQAEFMSERLNDAEESVKDADVHGLKALKAADAVREADRLFRARDYPEMLKRLELAGKELESAKREHADVGKAIDEAEERIGGAEKLGAEVAKASEVLARAREADAAGDYAGARERIREAGSAVEAAERALLHDMIAGTSAVVEEGDTMGADTKSARRSLTDAKKSLELGEFHKAAELARAALEDAEQRVQAHRKHLDMVTSTEKMIVEAEAEGLNMERARRLLDEARRTLKRFDYAAAVTALEGIQRDVETLTKQSKEARRIITFCEQKINTARKIGADVSTAEALINEAKAATEKRIFVKAFDLGTRTLKELDRMQYVVVLGFLMDNEIRFAEMEETGADVGEASDLVEVGLEALNENEFEKALELGRQAAEVARAKKFEHDASADTLRELEKKMKDASELGGDVRAIEELLSDGREALATHDYESVADLVLHGSDALNTALLKLVTGRAKDATQAITDVEETGANVARARDRIARAKRALECSDYKSALNLIEDSVKAAEDARHKHTETGEALREVQALAKEAGELGIDTARARKAISDLEAALEEGLYDEANRVIRETRADLEKAYSVQAEEALGKSAGALKKARELGANVTAEEKLLSDARAAHAKKVFAEVLRLCREAHNKSDERINEHIAEVILAAESLLQEAVKVGVETKVTKGLLERSEESIGEGDYEGALKLAKECMEKTKNLLRNNIKSTVATLDSLVEESRTMGADVKEVEEFAKLAEAALENDEYEAAHDQALSGIAAVDRVREEFIKKAITSLDLRIRDAEDMGAVTDDLRKNVEKARDHMENAEFDKAAIILKETDETTRKRQARLAEECIKKSEETMSKIKMDVDLAKARSLLDEAREAIKAGEYEEAMDYANQGSEEATRVQHQYVGDVISIAEESMQSAKDLGADVKAAGALCEAARAEQGSGSFESALEKATQCSEETEKAQKAFVQSPIDYCRKVMKEANLTDDKIKRLLTKAEKLLGEGEFSGAHAEVVRALELTEEIQEKFALNEISEAEEVLSAMEKSGAKSDEARKKLKEALEHLDKKDYEAARNASSICRETATKINEVYSVSTKALKEAEGEVTTLKEMELASEELTDILELARLEYGKGKYTEAKEFSDQALERTREVYVKTAGEALSSSQFKINYAKNIGGDVSSAETLLVEAKKAHEAKDFRKTVELARKCREEAEKAKERYKELVDTIYSAESKISVAHTYGLDTSAAEKLLSQAVTLKSKNGEEALDFARQSMEEVQRGLEKYAPEIKVDIKLGGQLHKEKWSEATMTISNSGKATAKDVTIRFSGDLDLQGVERVPAMRNGETRKQSVRVRPSKGGDLPLNITVICAREFDGKEFKSQETRWIRVEDAAPSAQPIGQFVTKSVRCHICLGTIKSGLPLIKCECGKTYHETCASRVGECPNCGRDLRNLSKQDGA